MNYKSIDLPAYFRYKSLDSNNTDDNSQFIYGELWAVNFDSEKSKRYNLLFKVHSFKNNRSWLFYGSRKFFNWVLCGIHKPSYSYQILDSDEWIFVEGGRKPYDFEANSGKPISFRVPDSLILRGTAISNCKNLCLSQSREIGKLYFPKTADPINFLIETTGVLGTIIRESQQVRELLAFFPRYRYNSKCECVSVPQFTVDLPKDSQQIACETNLRKSEYYEDEERDPTERDIIERYTISFIWKGNVINTSRNSEVDCTIPLASLQWRESKISGIKGQHYQQKVIFFVLRDKLCEVKESEASIPLLLCYDMYQILVGKERPSKIQNLFNMIGGLEEIESADQCQSLYISSLHIWKLLLEMNFQANGDLDLLSDWKNILDIIAKKIGARVKITARLIPIIREILFEYKYLINSERKKEILSLKLPELQKVDNQFIYLLRLKSGEWNAWLRKKIDNPVVIEDEGASDEEETNTMSSYTPIQPLEKMKSTKLRVDKIKELIPENFTPEPTSFKFESLSEMTPEKKEKMTISKPFDFVNL